VSWRTLAGACGAAASLACAAPAAAADLSAAEAVERTCQARLLPAGTPGTARSAHTPGATGVLTARLAGSGGDWDLALFDARTRELHNAGATATRSEQAIALVPEGRTVIAQACRRSGGGSTATLDFDLHEQLGPPVAREPAQMVRVALGAGRTLEQLEATGLDVTHDVGPDGATVVLYSAAERARLLAAGFSFRTTVPDLHKVDLARHRADEAYAGSLRASALPSGRTGYRTLADYGTDLKGLVSKFPAHVRRLEIGKSLEGRPIEGVEIAGNVNGRDGRPVLAVVGAHHAREWPSAEMPMEFAVDLANRYGKDARVTRLLDRVRVIALPVMNPDGFNVSRTAGPTPFDDDAISTLPLIISDGASYKRKNCRPTTGSESIPCITRPALQGVDLNRNYGAFWGGVGSSSDPTAQQFRGPAPYSEPESESFHKLSSTRSIMTVISHHTFTDNGIWLRQPGFCDADGCQAADDIVADEAGMKALGDSMGNATGWDSDLGWVIGEITGATEDWNYFAQGAYGYTPEQRGPNFHPTYQTAVVKEYDGTGPGAKGGVREALTLAGEQAANPSFHSVLIGVAPAGRVLRLRKSFATDTSMPEVKVQDRLDFTTVVPDSGFYNWHVNQSTRPLAAGPESYTLTCETSGGDVIETRAVTIARGEAQAIDLACGGPPADPPTPAPPATSGQLLCADTRAPVSAPTRGSLRISRSRVLVRGRASDHGCQPSGVLGARKGRLARVLAAVALRDGKRCRFLRPSGRLSSARSCARPLYVPARGLGSWTLKVKAPLPRGRYHVWSQSADTSGNVERKRRRILGGTVR
jgi:hypothetical protein